MPPAADQEVYPEHRLGSGCRTRCMAHTCGCHFVPEATATSTRWARIPVAT